MDISNFSAGNKFNWPCVYLGYEIEVSIDLEDGDKIEDYTSLVKTVDSWNDSFFKNLEPMLFAYYKNTLIMCGENEPVINNPSEIWKFLRIGSLSLLSNEEKRFILASGYCDWETEHGLEIDINENNQVVYVGSYISNGFYEDPNNPSTHNFVDGNA